MQRQTVTVIIPNPHGSDIGTGLLTRLLRQAGLSRQEWESV
jgi:predicted RNA binding protein YcfA (HicA-like mRNA interferase family)